jgi:hypothetical protein
MAHLLIQLLERKCKMSYLGYVNTMTEFCKAVYKENPSRPVKILEIGVDKAQTAMPLLSNLTTLGINFIFVGVDVREDETFKTQLQFLNGVRPAFCFENKIHTNSKNPNYYYVIENSLNYLPELEKQGIKFDCILLDGDHNYSTVSQELKFFDKITEEKAICFADDYNGKHAGKDAFYSEESTHEHVKHMFVDLENSEDKQGVNVAIDEFIEQSKNWKLTNKHPQFEPVIMTKNVVLG